MFRDAGGGRFLVGDLRPLPRALNPQYDQAADAKDGEVKFVKVSFQDSRDLFGEHGVRATPTLVLFRDGEEIARKVGAMRADDLQEWLDEHLAG